MELGITSDQIQNEPNLKLGGATMKTGDRLKKGFHHNGDHSDDKRHVKGSQYYPPVKSWTRSEVWWFDVPLEEVKRAFPDHIHFLCQKSISCDDFLHLKVPKSVLQQAVNKGCVEVIRQ